MSTSGAACPVCGGSCSSFTPTPHAADYPFLPGGETPMVDEKMHTAKGRMFDAAGTLAAVEGDKVPDSIWKGLTLENGYPAANADPADDAKAADTARSDAAAGSKKRGPARESR